MITHTINDIKPKPSRMKMQRHLSRLNEMLVLSYDTDTELAAHGRRCYLSLLAIVHKDGEAGSLLPHPNAAPRKWLFAIGDESGVTDVADEPPYHQTPDGWTL
jgi:hypothetical protein